MTQKIIKSPMINTEFENNDDEHPTHPTPLFQESNMIWEIGTKYNKNYRGSRNKTYDSQLGSHLKLTIINQVPLENHRMLRAAPLEQSVSVPTFPNVQFTNPFNVLIYDYSYLVVNTGLAPATAYLQISPDGTNWEVQSDIKTINPSILLSFVPDVIAKYARLGYRSQPATPNTTLQIYLQGRSYN